MSKNITISIACLVGKIKVKKSDISDIQPVIMDTVVQSVIDVMEETKHVSNVRIETLINEIEICD